MPDARAAAIHARHTRTALKVGTQAVCRPQGAPGLSFLEKKLPSDVQLGGAGTRERHPRALRNPDLLINVSKLPGQQALTARVRIE